MFNCSSPPAKKSTQVETRGMMMEQAIHYRKLLNTVGRALILGINERTVITLLFLLKIGAIVAYLIARSYSTFSRQRFICGTL